MPGIFLKLAGEKSREAVVSVVAGVLLTLADERSRGILVWMFALLIAGRALGGAVRGVVSAFEQLLDVPRKVLVKIREFIDEWYRRPAEAGQKDPRPAEMAGGKKGPQPAEIEARVAGGKKRESGGTGRAL